MTLDNWLWLSIRLLATLCLFGLLWGTCRRMKPHGAHVGYLLGIFHGVLVILLLDNLYLPD